MEVNNAEIVPLNMCNQSFRLLPFHVKMFEKSVTL